MNKEIGFSAGLTRAVVIAVVTGVSTAGLSQTYNAEADYSTDANPNGVWEYAWAMDLGDHPILYEMPESATRWDRGDDRYPDFGLMSVGLTMSPGGGDFTPGTEYSVLVYRAEFCQSISYDVEFRGRWEEPTVDGDLSIFVANELRFSGVLERASGMPLLDSGSGQLQQGETIEIWLGVGKNRSGEWDRAIVDLTIVAEPSADCCLADLAEPFGVLDLTDIGAFTSGFLAADPVADLAPPEGVFDLADIGVFVTAFLDGCP